MFQKSHIGV